MHQGKSPRTTSCVSDADFSRWCFLACHKHDIVHTTLSRSSWMMMLSTLPNGMPGTQSLLSQSCAGMQHHLRQEDCAVAPSFASRRSTGAFTAPCLMYIACCTVLVAVHASAVGTRLSLVSSTAPVTICQHVKCLSSAGSSMQACCST